MLVYAWIKIEDHPQPEGGGTQKGDIVLFTRTDRRAYGRKTLEFFLPVVVDITVPCGDDFDNYNTEKKAFTRLCARCEWANQDDCDVIKYTKAVWGAGDIDNAPRPIKNRKYNIDRTKFISELSEAVVVKLDKTEQEKLTILTDSANNPRPVTDIEDKEAILVESK